MLEKGGSNLLDLHAKGGGGRPGSPGGFRAHGPSPGFTTARPGEYRCCSDVRQGSPSDVLLGMPRIPGRILTVESNGLGELVWMANT